MRTEDQRLVTREAEVINVSPEAGMAQFDLSAYAKEYGIDISKRFLDPSEVVVLYLAHKLEPVIKDLKIPVSVVETPSDKKQLVEREVEKTVEKKTYIEGEKESPIPADKMDIDMISGPRDLPKILTPQWLLEDISPDLFYDRLANRQLMKPRWWETTHEEKVSYETVKQKELVEVPAPPTTQNRQHCYALIDVSGSMTQAQDGRDVLAKGLALAYLKSGYAQGSQLALRPFSGQPHQLWEGKSDHEFYAIAQTVIGLSMSQGGTDIQRALESAVSDIRRNGKYTRADVMLISDGFDELAANPLGNINLHTFIVGQEGYNGNLDAWSKSLRVLALSNLPEITPKADEIGYIREQATRLQHELETLREGNEAYAFVNELNAISQLAYVMQNYSGEIGRRGSAQIRQAIQELNELRMQVSGSGLEKIMQQNKIQAQMESERRKRIEEAYARAEEMRVQGELAKLQSQLKQFEQYQQQVADPTTQIDYEDFVDQQQQKNQQQSEVDLWQLIKKLAKKSWRFLKGGVNK